MNGRLSSEGMKINVGIKANKTNAGMLEGESKEEAQSSKLKAQRNGRILFREDGVRKFQGLFRRSLDINPRRWKEAVDRVWEYFSDDAVVIGIVPVNNEELKSRVMYRLGKKAR